MEWNCNRTDTNTRKRVEGKNLTQTLLNRISTAWITLTICFALLKPVEFKNECNLKHVFKCNTEKKCT